jgi:hypothetical protein
MIKGVRFNDIDDGSRIAKTAGNAFNPLVDQVIARCDDNGILMGGSVFTQWTGYGGSVAIHVAGFHPRWINRTILFVTFDYPFNQLGVKKLFGQVPSYNKKALDFDLHLGFKAEIIIPDVYPEGDLVLLSMKREECRFLDHPPRELVKDK